MGAGACSRAESISALLKAFDAAFLVMWWFRLWKVLGFCQAYKDPIVGFRTRTTTLCGIIKTRIRRRVSDFATHDCAVCLFEERSRLSVTTFSGLTVIIVGQEGTTTTSDPSTATLLYPNYQSELWINGYDFAPAFVATHAPLPAACGARGAGGGSDRFIY